MMDALLNLISIDPSLPMPAFRQIAAALRTILVAGQVSPGQTLPTVRRLAGKLKVHHNTVAQAYRVLAGEGWVQLRRGSGAIVLDRTPPKPMQKLNVQFNRQLRELVAKAIADGLSVGWVSRELRALGEALAEQ